MSKKAEYFTAYYIEYPDLGIATMIEVRPDGPRIMTGDSSERDLLLRWLSQAGVEVHAFTCTWETTEDLDNPGRECKIRRWQPIEAEAAVS